MTALEHIPLWVFFLITSGVVLVFIEAGFRLGRRCHRLGEHEPEPQIGAMVSSSLGLLAFLLAFTFNLAAGRYDDRRAAITTEANAIGTTYLRTDFIEEPSRSHVKKLLREYVASRLGAAEKSMEEVLAESELFHDQLWSEAAKVGNQHPDSEVIALFISSLNEVIDINEKRVNLGFRSRVPAIVWIALLAVAGLSMAGAGYCCGLTGNRGWTGIAVLVTCFGIVMVLVADLDRPQQGLIKTPQYALIDLSKKIGPP